MSDRSKEKQALFEQWIENDHILVHIDSRKPGVNVPTNLQANPALTLKLSYLFQGETKHDEKEVRSFLRFQQNYLECVLPWTAIWGFTSSEMQQKIWPEDLPPELLVTLAKEKFKELGQKIFSRKGKEQEKEKTTKGNPPSLTTDATRPTTSKAPGNIPESNKRDRASILKRIK